MYVSPNFKSKAALKRAIAAGEDITIFQPNNDIFNGVIPINGKVAVEGPHYPEPHRWYGQVILEDGKVVKVT